MYMLFAPATSTIPVESPSRTDPDPSPTKRNPSAELPLNLSMRSSEKNTAFVAVPESVEVVAPSALIFISAATVTSRLESFGMYGRVSVDEPAAHPLPPPHPKLTYAQSL